MQGNDMAKLKMLVFGAGVLGSLYAARLADAGHDVAVVARGRRYRDLREHGIVLEYVDSGERTVTPVRTLDAMPTDEPFDLCLVVVQKTQLDAALPVLASHERIPAFLFMVNTAEGPRAMIDALGRERVLLGFANAGGERDGHLVRLMVAKRKAVTMGELDGSRSDRLQRIGAAFEAAGFAVETCRHMDAWLRYHVALVVPWANGFYMAGGCNLRLARNRQGVQMALRAMREGIAVVRAHGFPLEPAVLRFVLPLPDFVLVPLMQRLLAAPIMDIGGKRHAMAAREEMTALSEELLALADEAGMETPTMRALHRFSDPAVPPAFAA
jgi:2-dehydropantoate 2-reductase